MEMASAASDDEGLRQALEASPDVIVTLSPQGRIEFMNKAGRTLFKVPDGTAPTGRSWMSLAPRATQEAIGDAVLTAAGGRIASFEAAFATKDSAETWWNIRISPVRDGEAAVRSLIATMHDVTAIKLASQAAASRLPEVTATAVVLRSALRLAQLDAWRYDDRRQTVAFTPELRDSLGKSAEDQPLSEALKIWAPKDRTRFKQCLEDAVESSGEVVFEGEILTEEGESRWLRVLGEPEIVDGCCVALRGASQDITEERAVLARIQASEETAHRAADAMSSFLATMSHEIRTPLNGVLGMAQAMAMGDLPETQREHLKVIRSSGESLLALLNDLLDLSKIEAGRIDLENGLIDPQTLATGIRVFETLLQAKGVRLDVVVTPGARGLWAGDLTRVRQVLNNLVSNAVKFTARGVVEVELADDGGDFVMRVRDSGIGIAADKLADVFSKFTQADSATTRRFGGTGLGLAICQELAKMMGGEITVESIRGKGSTFTARLPLAHVDTTERASSDPPLGAEDEGASEALGQDLRVLVAEDNPTNQLVLKTLLASVGVEPVVVGDGKAALKAWREGLWDIVLMDVHMPVLDGVRAVTEMRAIEQSERRSRTPVIALTANAMNHQRDEYMLAGMDAVVAKPIELPLLLGAMNDVIAAVATPSAPIEVCAGQPAGR